MKEVLLLGWPVTHSISPAIHNAAFAELGLRWRYRKLAVHPTDLPAALNDLRTAETMGANITIPHKQAVLPYLDELSPEAIRLGAVNTIANLQGRLYGDNTDLAGFRTDLLNHWDLDPLRPALILGSGGAARAVAFALAPHVQELRIINRHSTRSQDLFNNLRSHFPSLNTRALPWTEEGFTEARSGVGLLVHCTPLGTAPQVKDCPWPASIALPDHAFVYDLVYHPVQTVLLRRAQDQGLPNRNGLGMLVEQGALAFERWTQRKAPRPQMRAAALQALGGEA